MSATHVHVALPAITHNPWAPAYALTKEASYGFSKELADAHLRDARAQYPGACITVTVAGVPFAGFLPA